MAPNYCRLAHALQPDELFYLRSSVFPLPFVLTTAVAEARLLDKIESNKRKSRQLISTIVIRFMPLVEINCRGNSQVSFSHIVMTAASRQRACIGAFRFIATNLYYANDHRFTNEIRQLVEQARKPVCWIVIDTNASSTSTILPAV